MKRGCSGQVLVLHDMPGLGPDKPPRFVRNFMADSSGIADAVRRCVHAVKDGSFQRQRGDAGGIGKVRVRHGGTWRG